LIKCGSESVANVNAGSFQYVELVAVSQKRVFTTFDKLFAILTGEKKGEAGNS
jgi:hypothetical protein